MPSTRRTEYQGLLVTRSYLTVFFEEHINGSVRFREIKVPIGDLVRDDLSAAVDNHVRRRLIQTWSGDSALPGID